jgi:hypothetical protein
LLAQAREQKLRIIPAFRKCQIAGPWNSLSSRILSKLLVAWTMAILLAWHMGLYPFIWFPLVAVCLTNYNIPPLPPYVNTYSLDVLFCLEPGPAHDI